MFRSGDYLGDRDFNMILSHDVSPNAPDDGIPTLNFGGTMNNAQQLCYLRKDFDQEAMTNLFSTSYCVVAFDTCQVFPFNTRLTNVLLYRHNIQVQGLFCANRRYAGSFLQRPVRFFDYAKDQIRIYETSYSKVFIRNHIRFPNTITKKVTVIIPTTPAFPDGD